MEMIGKILNAFSPRKYLQPFFGNAHSAPEGTRQLSGNCSDHVRDPSQNGGKERRVAVTVPAEHRRAGSLETLDHVSGPRDPTPIPAYRLPAQGATDAYDALWRSIGKLPRPAFDRRGIIETARQVLVTKIDREIVVWALLRQQFMPTQLQEDFDADEAKTLDKRNYRRLILARKWIRETGQMDRSRQRPA